MPGTALRSVSNVVPLVTWTVRRSNRLPPLLTANTVTVPVPLPSYVATPVELMVEASVGRTPTGGVQVTEMNAGVMLTRRAVELVPPSGRPPFQVAFTPKFTGNEALSWRPVTLSLTTQASGTVTFSPAERGAVIRPEVATTTLPVASGYVSAPE